MSTEDLPDECLSRVFSLLSSETGSYAHALVCRRWRALAPEAQAGVAVETGRLALGCTIGDGGNGRRQPPARQQESEAEVVVDAVENGGARDENRPENQGLPLPSPVLLAELAAFPRLTSLRLGPGSLQLLTDRLLLGLAAQCPHLRRLYVAQQAAPVASFSAAGLAGLFAGCPGLDSCLLHACGDVLELPANIASLPSLETLEFGSWTGSYSWRTYPNLTALPENFGALAPSLRTLTLVSRSLHKLPGSFSSLSSLRELNLHSVELGDLPENIGQLTSLETLRIRSQLLSSLPESLGQLRSLRHLCLNFCNCLFELPASFGQLQGLRSLEIINCYALLLLPESFSRLRSLERLAIHGCAHLGSLPENFGSLSSLKSLSLRFARRLKSLPPSLGSLGALEFLEIQTCDRIQELPGSLGSLRSLRSLMVSGCRRITTLPPSLGALTGLTRLEVSECSGLTEVPPTLQHLPSLQSCVIRDICGASEEERSASQC